MLTQTEENYLKTIFKLSDHGREYVFTNQIAEKIGTQAASVSDMLKKLAIKKFINYEKYKGVLLTDTGIHHACIIIRKHRLWEVFLVNKLNFAWDQVHEVAEQLEHIKSEILIDKLDDFLGHPKFDPHGWPIPDKWGKLQYQESVPLNSLNPLSEVALVKVIGENGILQHLDELNISIGAVIKILSIRNFDGLIEIEVNQKKEFLTKSVAENLYVKKRIDL